MKIDIYHYEKTYKFLLGKEIVEDERPSIGLPAFSTDIRPPLESCPSGHIPVFNGMGWDIVEDTFWRPQVIERNYDAGRLMSSYAPLALSIYCQLFPHYPSMPMLCNTNQVVFAICQKTRMVHRKFDDIVGLHKEIFSDKSRPIPLDGPDYLAQSSAPSPLYQYKLEAEAMVFLMRRVLDCLVQLSYLLTNYHDFERTKSIAVNEIGKFFQVEDPETDLQRIILGDGEKYRKDPTGFLVVINDLFNSFKHCLMHDESYVLMSEELPTIVSYQAKNNDHKNSIIYHNYNAFHLMMGFQDTVARILENQRAYVATRITDQSQHG